LLLAHVAVLLEHAVTSAPADLLELAVALALTARRDRSPSCILADRRLY
jgi:hypothetical protein